MGESLKSNDIYNPNSIFKTKKDEAVGITPPDREYVCFGSNGEELEESSKDVHAKVVRVNTRLTYYILFNQNNKMTNPIDAFDSLSKLRRKTQSQKPSVLRPVTPKAFEFYVQYLQTRNPALLLNAEREN